MFNTSKCQVIVFFVLSLFLYSLAGAVPHEMNYQGKVTDGSGIPLNGAYGMKFHLFNSSIDVNELWNE